MRYKCKRWDCGCWAYSVTEQERGNAVTCKGCPHPPEAHAHTCGCGEKEFLGFCKWDWLWASIIASVFVAAIVIA